MLWQLDLDASSKQYSTKLQLLPIFIFYILVISSKVSRAVDCKNENIIRTTVTMDKSSKFGPGVFWGKRLYLLRRSNGSLQYISYLWAIQKSATICDI